MTGYRKEQAEYTAVINSICDLNWGKISNDELGRIAHAYYYFSIQFRENLEIACQLYPDDENLKSLRDGECDTDNLSPWPGVAAIGERMHHDEFMRRLLILELDCWTQQVEQCGREYLTRVRGFDLVAKAKSIASYEDNGLRRTFLAMLRAQKWQGPVAEAFRFFLEQHIEFDTDDDAGHGTLAKHLNADDAVVPFWRCFAELLIAAVPRLGHRAALRRTVVADQLVIGLVNNMPDAALRTTELQVRTLLNRAAGDRPVRLRVFSMPDVPRSEYGRQHIAQFHEPIEDLWESDVAGLIVTGTEPKTPCLADEPYWPALAGLIDWASANTVSTIWSCLAAHAAVFHLDRIEREPCDGKLTGLFDCMRIDDHPLVSGLSHWQVPHSRFNDLPEAALRRAGYKVLSRADRAGVDTFVKDLNKSLFIFLQGHPEYDGTALFGEYRRDIRRYLAGEAAYPELPHGYFSDAATKLLMEFRDLAMQQDCSVTLLEQFPAQRVAVDLSHTWRDDAARIYSNWFTCLQC